ncbi:unnamed protein product [Meloidogyne enterolobii]|uniref:Uncharacterized protein n=1 Tax=Meloidogyne enterolobii TaxID=390850 RepID=A0ACB0ZMB3_MELEN
MDLKNYLNNKDNKIKNFSDNKKIEDFEVELEEEKNEKLKEEGNENLEEEKNEDLEEELEDEKIEDSENNEELNEANKDLLSANDKKLFKNLNNEDEKHDIIYINEENILKNGEKEDNKLVPINKGISKGNHKNFKSLSKFTPFHPRIFLEEKILIEAYEKFISGRGDPKKIIPALEIGVVIDEIKQRFEYIKKFKQNKIDTELDCENANSTGISFGSLEGKVFHCYLTPYSFALSVFSRKI